MDPFYYPSEGSQDLSHIEANVSRVNRLSPLPE